MNLIDLIYQVFPTVLGWVTDAIEFAQWVSEQFYVNIYVALLNAVGVPVEIANTIIATIGIIAFGCTIIKLINEYS